MRRRIILLGTAVTVVTAACIAAGVVVQQAFTKTEVQTIASAKHASESRVLALRGKIVNYRPKDNVFILKDSSGSAQLYTCPGWYKKVQIKDGIMANVTGHIMTQKPDAPGTLYVLAAHTIDLPGGKQVLLRTTLGKPPWASGVHIRAQK